MRAIQAVRKALFYLLAKFIPGMGGNAKPLTSIDASSNDVIADLNADYENDDELEGWTRVRQGRFFGYEDSDDSDGRGQISIIE